MTTQIEERSDKGTTVQKNVITTELYWRLLLPDFPPPANRFIAGWCKTNDLDTVLAQVEYMARLARKGYVTSSAEIGRRISAFLRSKREQFIN